MALSPGVVARITALCLVLGPGAALAQDVELRSLDGTVTLEGNLISYDGAYYRLETIYGPVTIAAEGVACAGPGCPDLTTFVAEARIAGEAIIAEGLLPALLAGFAESRGMTLGMPEANGRAALDYAPQRRARGHGSKHGGAVTRRAPGSSDILRVLSAWLRRYPMLALTAVRAPTSDGSSQARRKRIGDPECRMACATLSRTP